MVISKEENKKSAQNLKTFWLFHILLPQNVAIVLEIFQIVGSHTNIFPKNYKRNKPPKKYPLC
jgi:hypothetical protein